MGRARELNLTPLLSEVWLRGGLQSWSPAVKWTGKKSQFYEAQCTSSQASAPSPWIASRSPIHHLVPHDDAAALQSEPFFNISQRKGRQKQKDHLLPLIEKQDRKTDKPRKIGTIPRTSTDPREQGDECGTKNESLLLLLPCDSNTRLSPYTSHLGTENLFTRRSVPPKWSQLHLPRRSCPSTISLVIHNLILFLLGQK